jgi:integrase/recombinase XerD
MNELNQLGFNNLLNEFEDYLQTVTDSSKGTIYNQTYNAKQFLKAKCIAENKKISDLSPLDLTNYIMSLADKYARTTLQNRLNCLKGFVRFLYIKEYCSESLTKSIPTMPTWKRAKVPSTLKAKAIEEFLSSFKLHLPLEKRNYAIALLLLRLGLRSSEVVALTLDDIDWKNGVLQINNKKCRRIDRLPLPEEVGNTLVDYLKNGRPKTKCKNIFVHHYKTTLGQSLHPSTIGSGVGYRLKKLGLDLPQYGSHIMRRTVASQMIQSGASLKEVADTLRHRDLDTTKIYTKVNIPMLREVALPWPEVMK